MKLGFLGSGTIAAAVICGIEAADLKIKQIYVSSLNAETPKRLAAKFPNIKIGKDNQDVVDNADIIFVALPGAVSAKILQSLRFHAGQKLVSFVPTLQLAEIEKLVQHKVAVIRAVPLPFIEEHKTVTPIFPADKALHDIFAHTGGVIEVEKEHELNVFMTAASFMGVYYAFTAAFDKWLSAKTADKAEAGQFLARLFAALAEQAAKQGKKVDFPKLQEEYSTKGGTNELIARHFKDSGGHEALTKALDEGFREMSRK